MYVCLTYDCMSRKRVWKDTYLDRLARCKHWPLGEVKRSKKVEMDYIKIKKLSKDMLPLGMSVCIDA